MGLSLYLQLFCNIVDLVIGHLVNFNQTQVYLVLHSLSNLIDLSYRVQSIIKTAFKRSDHALLFILNFDCITFKITLILFDVVVPVDFPEFSCSLQRNVQGWRIQDIVQLNMLKVFTPVFF